jgi:outer membrane protein assembly factor BamB
MLPSKPEPMRVAAALLLLLVASGCSVFKNKTNRENVEPPSELTDIADPVAVDRLWSASLGEGEGKLGLRQAVVLDGARLYAAGVDGTVAAYDAASGKRLWEVETDERFSGGPGIGDGTLVVASLDGTVIAYNPDNGNERWRATVSSEVISRPAVGRGVAVVRVNDGRAFAFSITDGSRRWVYDRGLPSLTLRGNAAPVLAGDNVILGYDSGIVVALKLLDGAQVWEQTVAQGEGRNELDRMVDIDGEIIVSGSEVYVASFNGQILALDLGSGRPLWNREMSVYTGLALSGDRLLVTDKAATVWALDRRSGAALWRQDGLAHRWLTTPSVVGELVAVGDLEGYVHWLALDGGEIVGRERVGRDPIRATPQSQDGVLFAQTVDGKLAAYRASR